ncbi:hypothetical protein Srufu_076760 [Streptomyces libani subsp. rufus]|nr:hypothetical protein Srufu_076760 [Streptomyces libani subsp. rufus]
MGKGGLVKHPLTERRSSRPTAFATPGVVLEEEAGASSRLRPLQRPKFGELLAQAIPAQRKARREYGNRINGVLTTHRVHKIDLIMRDCRFG